MTTGLLTSYTYMQNYIKEHERRCPAFPELTTFKNVWSSFIDVFATKLLAKVPIDRRFNVVIRLR